MARRGFSDSSCILLTSIAALAVQAAVTLGNDYPTNLGQSANAFTTGQNVTLSYLLNENATGGVGVSILNASNSVVRTISGGTALGVNQVVWDGKDNSNNNLPSGNYTFRVTSTGDTRAAWTQISTDTTLNNFELPRGVAVNTNANSPYYGRVYVSNPRTNATAAGRAMGEGLYMLNSDLSETGIAGGTGPYTGGVDWTLDGTGGTGPFRLQVGPDDSVYVTDWSDTHSGLWQAPAHLGGAWTEVLDSSQCRSGTGATNVHGSISDVVITGTGANRKLYTADEDLGPGDILYYNIGTDPVFTEDAALDPNHSGVFFNNVNSKADAGGGAGNWNINFFNSIAVDKRGDFWYSQNRSGGTDVASLVRIDPATGHINWNSLTTLGSPDPLRGLQGMAYDPLNDLLALVTNITTTGGNIIIFDPVAQAILTQFAFGSTTNTDVAFDNAGNLYVGNRSAERVRVWSPPNGSISGRTYVNNLFSTDSAGALGNIVLTAGAGVVGDYNGDNIVDARDYIVWRKNPGAHGNAQGYSDWRTHFGAGSGSGLGDLASIPEPASCTLVALGMAAIGLISRRRRCA
jgi:hypothetical protein